MTAKSARRALEKQLAALDPLWQTEQWASLALALDTWQDADLVKLAKGLEARRTEIRATYIGPKC